VAQYVTLANRVFRVTMAALPEFSDKRSTSNPSIVLGFSVGIVVVLVALFASLGFYQYKKDMAVAKADAERRQQTALVMNAAKDAHEKTIAYACHQLRNPLQSIVGSISFLKERFLKDDDCYEDISAIAGAASDMSRVIDDISDWVKVSVGQLELNLEAVTLKSLLEDVVRWSFARRLVGLRTRVMAVFCLSRRSKSTGST
jgi:signal transduction histidine kinase